MRVIQVGGTVRSGTTITGLILANSSNAIALGEVMHLFKPYKQLHYKKIKELKQDKIWARILENKAENLYRSIFEFYPEVDLIVDSSKDPFWFDEQVKWNSGMEMKQLVTYKTMTGLKGSFEKRNLNNWLKVYINYYRRFFTLFPDAPSIYIESLLRQNTSLESLCKYLDVDFSADRLKYWERDQPNHFGSKTVKKKFISKETNIYIQNELGDRKYSKARLIEKILCEKDIAETKINSRSIVSCDLRYNSLLMSMYKYKDYVFR